MSDTHRDLMRIMPSVSTSLAASSMTTTSSIDHVLTNNDAMDEDAEQDGINSISFVDQLYTTDGPQLKEYSQLLPQDLLVPDDVDGECEEPAQAHHGSPLSAGRTPLSQPSNLPDDPELMALADNPKIQTLLYK